MQVYNKVIKEHVNIPDDIYYLRPNYDLSEIDKQTIFDILFKHNLVPCTYTVDKLYKAYHIGSDKQCDATAMLLDNAIYDDIYDVFVPRDKEELEKEFLAHPKFGRHGAPKILNAISNTYSTIKNVHPEYQIKAEEFISNFNVRSVKKMVDAKIPLKYVPLFYLQFTPVQCENLANHPDKAYYLGEILEEAFIIDGTDRADNKKAIAAANWCIEHLNTRDDLLKKIRKNYSDIEITNEDTVEGVEAELKSLDALPEIKRIEKRYKKPGFTFDEVTCELKDVAKIVSDHQYNAYIMDPQDPRQVLLGDYTYCCQKLDDAGESAMMHGLLNPKAGFFIIEDKNSKEIKAQAEVWEDNENTLVFDNIEFANDADISLYIHILSKWLQNTEYNNVVMGLGYNTLGYDRNFKHTEARTPSVTPREIYVISYEQGSEAPVFKSEEEAKTALEEHRVTYFDYVYCDSERNSVFLKENGVITPAFLTNKDIFINCFLAYTLKNTTSLPSDFGKTIVDLSKDLIYYEPEGYDKAEVFEDVCILTENFTKTGELDKDQVYRYVENEHKGVSFDKQQEVAEAIFSAYTYYTNPDIIVEFGYNPPNECDNLDYDNENDYDEDYEDDDYDDEYNDEYID